MNTKLLEVVHDLVGFVLELLTESDAKDAQVKAMTAQLNQSAAALERAIKGAQ